MQKENFHTYIGFQFSLSYLSTHFEVHFRKKFRRSNLHQKLLQKLRCQLPFSFKHSWAYFPSVSSFDKTVPPGESWQCTTKTGDLYWGLNFKNCSKPSVLPMSFHKYHSTSGKRNEKRTRLYRQQRCVVVVVVQSRKDVYIYIYIYKLLQPQFAGGCFTFSFYLFISMNGLITFELCGYHSSHNSIQSSFSSLVWV